MYTRYGTCNMCTCILRTHTIHICRNRSRYCTINVTCSICIRVICVCISYVPLLSLSHIAHHTTHCTRCRCAWSRNSWRACEPQNGVCTRAVRKAAFYASTRSRKLVKMAERSHTAAGAAPAAMLRVTMRMMMLSHCAWLRVYDGGDITRWHNNNFEC